jgi:hypothetical protein
MLRQPVAHLPSDQPWAFTHLAGYAQHGELLEAKRSQARFEGDLQRAAFWVLAPADLGKFIADETEKLGKVVKFVRMKPE